MPNKKLTVGSSSNITDLEVTGIITSNNFQGKFTPTVTTVSLTTAGWSSNTQSVTCTGVTTSNLIEVSPAPASFDAYSKARVYCSAQAANSLTFKCTTTPTTALTVNVIIWN